MLKERTDGLFHRNLRGPGTCPCRFVFDREAVLNSLGIHSRESLDNSQVFTGASQRVFAVEIRRLHNQRVAFPMPARVTGPLRDASRYRRTAIGRDYPNIVILLEEN